MRNFLLLNLALALLMTPIVYAQQPPEDGEVVFRAKFEIADASGNPIGVVVRYNGTPFEGRAVAIYTDANGVETRDPMRGCNLTTANSISTILCSNPHMITMDGLRHSVWVSSPVVTNGQLQNFEVQKELQVRLVFRRNAR